MTEKNLLDSDVLIDYLRDNPKAVKFLENAFAKSTCYISPITIAELYAGVREGRERHVLDQFLKVFELVEIDAHIAEKGGLYRRDFGKSHGAGLADAFIAASAEAAHATLITLNKKHYPMLKKIHVPYTK